MSMSTFVKQDENGNWPTFNQGGVDQTLAYKDVSATWASTVNGDSTVFNVLGYHSLSATIIISAAATVTYFISNDSVTWSALRNTSESGASGSSQGSTGVVRLNLSGAKYFKWVVASNTGTVSIIGQVTLGSYTYQIPSGLNGGADAQSTSVALANSGSYMYAYNDKTGTQSWDRFRNNITGMGMASGTRTATTTSSDITNYNHRGIFISLNITAASGTGGLQLQVFSKNIGVSSTYKAIHTATAAITATGEYTFMLYPGVDTALNVSGQQIISEVLPQTFRIQVTHGDSSNYTYSVYYQLIL